MAKVSEKATKDRIKDLRRYIKLAISEDSIRDYFDNVCAKGWKGKLTPEHIEIICVQMGIAYQEHLNEVRSNILN